MKKIITLVVFLISLGSFAQTGIDRIFMVDRSIKEGTIISISDNLVIFEENVQPKNRVQIRLATIWKILYSNGFEEVFNQPLPEAIVSGSVPLEKVKPLDQIESFIFKFSDNQDWRPVLSVDFAGMIPVLFGPKELTSIDEGLALRFGLGGELGFSFNPFKNFGISFIQGYSNHTSYLPEIPLSDSTSTPKEAIKLTSLPTTFKLNFYPSRSVVVSGGLTTSAISITNSNPNLNRKRVSGYVIGVGKILPVGSQRNYFEFSLNYSALTSSELVGFQLDTEKYPQYDELNLVFNNLNLVDIKLKFHFNVVN